MLLRNWLLHYPNALQATTCFLAINNIYGDNGSMIVVVQEDTKLVNDSKYPFYVITCDKPRESWSPYRGVILGNFVFNHPKDTTIYHVWMGQTLTTLQQDKNHSHYI